MNIKDLEKEDYFLYTNTMNSIEASYNRTFYVFALLLVLSIVAVMSGSSLFLGILSIILCGLMLTLNYASVLAKFTHVKKLYKLNNGFSLLK